MGYSSKNSHVRIDRFKSRTGKWYDSLELDMYGFYNESLIHDALRKAIEKQFNESINNFLEDGFFIVVCLKPYHVHSHPIILKL
jgi:hypothetical protein